METKDDGGISDIDDHDWWDIIAPDRVEVLIRHDGKVVWVNVDGICRFRACRIVNLEVNDERKSND